MQTIEYFLPSVGSTFNVQLDDGGEFPITLFEATPLKGGNYPGQTREPFQLKFRGEESILLHQLTHRLRHESLGELDIFLVPIGPENGNFLYQAVFN